MFPKISTPLAKSIRTGEGILVYASNVGLVLLGALPHGLSWEKSALFGTILNGLHVIGRSAVKVSAINAGLGMGPVIPVANAPLSGVTPGEPTPPAITTESSHV